MLIYPAAPLNRIKTAAHLNKGKMHIQNVKVANYLPIAIVGQSMTGSSLNYPFRSRRSKHANKNQIQMNVLLRLGSSVHINWSSETRIHRQV